MSAAETTRFSDLSASPVRALSQTEVKSVLSDLRDWGKEHAHGTVLFAEYHSYPQDADCGCADSCRPFAQRADFVDTLDGAQAAHFSRELVLAGDDGWLP